ncbi:MAG: hypothetical protein RI932_1984 [Pseudomonadota bacterium]|jgi:aspartoacylase
MRVQIPTQYKLKHVLVSGGTHGNEYTGAFLARHWAGDSSSLQRTSFSTHVLLSNPAAFKMCRRYVERDLNRSFSPSGELTNPGALELSRADEIQNDLLEKCDGVLPDAIFDLHSTTANMGLSLVLTNREPFNLFLLGYLRERFENVNAYLWEEPGSRPGFLNSLSPRGFAIEIGPVANGVLNAEWVRKTSDLVEGCLDFIEKINSDEMLTLPEKVPLYRFVKHIDYPRAADGLPAGMIHPHLQNRDFQELKKGDPIFLGFDGTTVRWQEEGLWAVFINEAAYYEKGIAFTVTERLEIDLKDLR